jgi:hypothetical protein
MKVDDEIEALRSEPSHQREIRSKTGVRGDDDRVQVRIVFNEGRSMWFDEVGEVRVRKSLPDAPNGWRREHDVADLTQANEENSHIQFSIVASSMSITGMSSLMGYTR